MLAALLTVLAACAATTSSTPLPAVSRAEATGRFALTRQGERWVLHSPDGSPTFLLALNHLANPFYFDVIEGAAGLGPCHPYDAQCLEHDLLGTRYHANWSAATAEFVRNSKEWGFNSAGYEYVPAPSVPWSYLPDLFVTNASHIFAKSADYTLSFPDVFDDAFNASTDARVKEWIATDQHVGHPRVLEQVVGYYFEDQALWNVTGARSAPRAPNRTGPTDWAVAMRTLPTAAPGKAAYVEWLEQRYASRGGLNTARAVYHIPASVSSWRELREYGFQSVDELGVEVQNDDNVFIGVVAEQYFSVAAAAVRRHDPEGLVFGQRFLGNDTPDAVMAAAGRHFDVISVQPAPFSFEDDNEAEASAAELARVSRAAGGRPVFVADQATHFMVPSTPLRAPCFVDENGRVHGCAANATAAGELYAQYLAELRQRPELIGYSHCQYINRAVCPGSADSQRAVECRGANPSNLHLKQGLLNFDGTPQREYVRLVAAANRKYGTLGPDASLKTDDASSVDQLTECTASSNATAAVHGLLRRLLPVYVAEQFYLEHCHIPPRSVAGYKRAGRGLVDAFEVLPGPSSAAVVHIRGSSGVALASGLRHYLWHYANTSFSWWGDNLANLPAVGAPLPSPPAGGVRRNTTLKYRMAINSCAFGYSTPYWNYSRWVREVDLMALKGINIVNQHEGGAWVYQEVFRQLGINRSDMPFPAASQGQDSGTMGGPRPQTFIDGHRELQKKVIAQMTTFGMAPLLQVWDGSVPAVFASNYPDADILARPGGLPGGGGAASHAGGDVGDVLQPTDPLYRKIGGMFVSVARKTFGGLEHYYDGGTFFDEGNTAYLNKSYVQMVARAAFEAMASGDPDAVWIDSAWRFWPEGASGFWQKDNGAATEAYLTAFPAGRHISRNIAADKETGISMNGRNNTYMWNATSSFFNTPWIYGQAQNFGGRTGLYGRLDQAAYDFPKAYAQAATLEGIGTFSESLEQNPVVDDLLLSQMWEMPTGIGDTTSWLRMYVQARYPAPVPASAHRAWELLHHGMYNCGCFDAPCAFGCQDPSMSVIGNNPSCSTNNPPWVCTGNPDDTSVGEAWAVLLQTAASGGARYRLSDTFAYDLVMVTAQALNMVMFDAQNRTVSAYEARNLDAIKAQRAVLLGALAGLDDLMGTRSLFLLGNWLSPAREWANSTAPYTATCDADENTKRTACTRPFVGAARVCDGTKGSSNKITTNCTISANCATCVDGSFGTVNESPCLTCKPGYVFFDWGCHGCTGSCNSDTHTDIPVDICEFRNCCFNDSTLGVASCFERPRSPEAQFVIDAKTVITLLGTSGSASQEYADRMWQGMIGDYYLPRWSQWFDFVETTLATNTTYDETPFTAALRVWQENWILSDTWYRTEPHGNAVNISAALFAKYSHLLRGGTPKVKTDDSAGGIVCSRNIMLW